MVCWRWVYNVGPVLDQRRVMLVRWHWPNFGSMSTWHIFIPMPMLVGNTTLFISSRATCENIQVYFFFTVKTNLKLYLKGTENKTNKFCKIKLCCIIALKCRIQEADPEIISHSLTKQLEQIKVFTAWCWPVSMVIVIFDMLGWPNMLLLCMSSGSLLTVSIKNEDFLFISSFFTLHIEKLKLFILRIQ